MCSSDLFKNPLVRANVVVKSVRTGLLFSGRICAVGAPCSRSPVEDRAWQLSRLFGPERGVSVDPELIYCFGGEASFSAVRQSGEKRNFYLKKGELLIQKSSNDISRYEVSGNNFCFLTVEFYLDCLISNLSEIMTHDRDRKSVV